MTTEQQRRILEFAAKACGLEVTFGIHESGHESCWRGAYEWNPKVYPADCAVMCAELRISVLYEHDPCEFLGCFAHNRHEPEIAHYKDHDNSRIKAWMAAATMVAAKIGGYTE